MGILNIRPVVRGQSKAIIGIAGVSGSGKTYTALKIARGMVSKSSEIGLLDTENGRGSFYADILDGPFMIGDLFPPFSPKRYSDALKEFQDAGVKVLVIDSVTHEWEGEGGCDDIAHQKIGKMDNWIGAKQEHKKFMNTLLQSKMHIIACIRAREKTDFKNPKEPISLGLQPICEKNFMFELMASMLIEDEGKSQKFLKMPSYLKKMFGDGNGYLGEAVGKSIIEWLDSGEKEDPEVARHKSELRMICEQGVEALKEAYKKVPKDIRQKINSEWPVYESAAKAYDDSKETPPQIHVEINEESLQELYDSKLMEMTNAQKINYKRIIANKEEASYKKAYDELLALKPVMP